MGSKKASRYKYEFQTALWEICNNGPDRKTALCPCYVTALNKAEVDGRYCTICDFIFFPSEYHIRRLIRVSYHRDPDREQLTYSPLSDCALVLFCYHLVVCQHNRELRIRRQENELNWAQKVFASQAAQSGVTSAPAQQNMV